MSVSSFPGRYRVNEQEAREISRRLLRFIEDKQGLEPTEKQWKRLGNALTQGDSAADKVAQWIAQQPKGKGYAAFERALARPGVEGSTPEPIVSLLSLAAQDPTWLDRTRLRRAANVIARSGHTGMRVLRDFGLMAGYQASAINQTLLKTGSLEKGAARRVAETTKWWMDCTECGGMELHAQGYVSTIRVRVIHALVRHQVANSGDWDAEYFGVPVNQLDMQATYLGFSAMFLLGQRVLGVLVSREEAEDVMHLWRYIGWLMGVNDDLLCESEQDARLALYHNLLCQAMADENSQLLARALMNEPLERHYSSVSPGWLNAIGWPALCAHWDKAVHLSIVRLAVGAKGMKSLGLPAHILPWYPLLCAPVNVLWGALHRMLPGGLSRQTFVGRRIQRKRLAICFGNDSPALLAVKNAAVTSASS